VDGTHGTAADANVFVSFLLLLLLQVRMHIGLDHENIISLYAAFQEAGNVVMVQVGTHLWWRQWGQLILSTAA
jgi:hypothetical protein